MTTSDVPNEDWSTRDDDRAMESGVLSRVLDVHPVRLTVAELIRELAGEEADFGIRDAIERAARDLSGVGLIHLASPEAGDPSSVGGKFVAPTRAALRYSELLDR